MSEKPGVETREARRCLHSPDNGLSGLRSHRHVFQPDTPRRAPAIAAMFMAGMLFAVMGICTKAMSQGAAGDPLPAAETALFRFAFGVLVMLPLHGRRGIDLLGNDRHGLVWRGVYGGVAVLFYFLSLQYTSLTHAVLLNYTSLIFAPFFAIVFLRERVTPRGLCAIAVAVAGILLVTRPESGVPRLGDLFGLVSGLLAGAAVTEVRRLRRTETAWAVFFYFSLIGVPLAAGACAVQRPVWPAPSGWLLLAVMAAASVGAQLLMTYGYKHVRVTEGTLMTLTQIVYNAAAGALLFREPLTAATLAGGALILGAGVWLSAVGQGR